ncbi:MAG: metallophosphoesterase family protein [Ruminococcaceae bacterium]|nr:metallophosphoesterase family protein [Oscillospiraceae bacterium]
MKKTAKRSLAVLLAIMMLFSCVGVGASAERTTGFETLRVNCTMYGDTKTQRGFTWYTEKSCDGVIQIVKASEYEGSFGNSTVYEATTKEFQGYYGHKVVVTGLEPGTTYYYRVGSLNKNAWSQTGKFVTDNGDKKFSFIALADVQASSLENFQQAALVMDAAMQSNKKAEFVVNLGDFVNDCTNEEWNWYGEAFMEANTNLTLVPVAGNHEGNITNKLNVGWFDNMFNLDAGKGAGNGVNGTYYSFDYGNAHFCVVNSNDMYPMVEAQRNWIINDLSNSNAHWKFLLLHRAPYSAGKNINKPDTLAMRETIIEIVDQTDVDIVLSGHDHMYFRTKQVAGDAVCEDVTYVTEKFNGVDTTFAKNPDGAVYILPSTAGTKRYTVNENPIDPINDCADVALSTRDLGGCFSNIYVDGNKLVYEAYVVNDETQEVTKIDEYAIKKTTKAEEKEESKLPTDAIGSLDGSVANFFAEIFGLLVTYIKFIPQLIAGLF